MRTRETTTAIPAQPTPSDPPNGIVSAMLAPDGTQPEMTPADAAGSRVDLARPERADEEGLREAFLAHGGEIFGYARRSLGDTGAAEDVVQETFVRAWRGRGRYDSSLGTLRTWLFAIARRVVIDHSRARAVRQTASMSNVEADDDALERAMVGWQVEEALRRLGPQHRQVLVDTYYRGLSGPDVAAALGIPEGTVRSRLFHALRRLRLALEEMGWDG